jgi:C-terminal processing protease CtpA/Prc
MVTLLCSFFFQKRTRLTTMFTRESGRAEDIWSDETRPGGIADSVPVYVLTSRRTFSAGEAFAYQLQMLKRATIVGEVTGGGARPARPRRIDDHFFMNVPYARMINPVSGTDWEGVGVQPDVRVPEGEALETARRLAAARLAERR